MPAPCPEQRNADYALRAHACARPAASSCQLEARLAQVGVFERDPFKAAALIREWLTTKRAELAAMAARAKALGQPHALENIVGDLATLVAA
jgi:hypothetical protein